MTDDNTTEVNETEGAASGSVEDNELIRSLRAQIKEQDKALKAVPNRSELEAQIRSAVERENAIESQLVALGQPKGLRPLIEEKLGDAEVAPEGVVEALKAIGFEITDSADGGAENQVAQEALAGVTSLSNQVAQAATAKPGGNLDEKIANAQTPAELAAIMAEADL